MDLYCQKCGEPYDCDHVHNEMSSEERNGFLHGEHCPACKGKTVEKVPFRAQLSSALSDILGNDLDGIAAEMEDAEAMFGGEFWD